MLSLSGRAASHRGNHVSRSPRIRGVVDLLLLAVGLALIASPTLLLSPARLAAQAAEPPDSLVGASEAVARVAEEGRLAPDLRAGTATRARLSHVLAGDRVVPGSWVVLVEGADGRPAGIVGIDPGTGSFQFETHVDAGYDFPEFDAGRVSSVLSRNGLEPGDWALDRARFTFLGGKAKGNFWVVPHASGRFEDYLAVPAFGRSLHAHLDVKPLVELEGGRAYYRLGDGVLAQARKSIGGDPPAPDPVFTIDPGTGDGDVGTGSASRPGSGDRRGPAAGGSARRTKASGRAPAVGRAGLQATATDTSIASSVPVYDQGSTNRCGKYALAMIHQWWSPERLGSGGDQVDEIADYLGGSHGGFHRTNWRWILTPGVSDVMNNWHRVDSDYEDFQTTWSGRTSPVGTGAPTGQSDDLKSWIHFLDAPVAVVGDSDGNSPVGHAIDHWVVVTGYDDASRKLYLNNSGASVGTSGGGTRGAVDYSFWNNTFTPHNRSKMVAGYPGDRDHARAGSNRGFSAGAVADSARLELSPVGLSVSGDDAAGGTDAFGQPYESTVSLVVDRPQGWFEDATSGGFDAASVSSDSTRARFARSAALGAGSSVSGASAYLDFFGSGGSRGRLGEDSVTVLRVVHDEDDRVRGDTSITVDSDGDSGGTLRMPKPVLRPDTLEVRRSYRVEDDDGQGPTVTNRRPGPGTTVPDSAWPSGGYAVRADVTDPSGLEEVRFRWEVADLPSGTAVASGSDTVGPHGSGTYRYDVPRSDWFGHDRITWWVEATDDDADRPGDRASFSSPPFTVRLTDDDTAGPTVQSARDTFTTVTAGSRKIRRYTLRVRLDDPSGVLDDRTHPTVYYRYGGRFTTPAVDSSRSDGFAHLSRSGSWYRATVADTVRSNGGVFRTLYWRVRSTDDDSDRSRDRASAWSRVFSTERARPAGKLCVSPNPPDHDFGTVPASGGGTRRSWTFTVENCGGPRAESITVFQRLAESLTESATGRRPSCPHGASDCWLNVGGIGSRGERLFGGDTARVSVTVDPAGLDYQVSPLSPGRYEAVVRILRGQASVRGTLRVAVPDSTGDVPDEDDETGDSGACWVGVEGGRVRTDLLAPGADYATESRRSGLGGLALRCDVLGPLGFRTGGYYVRRSATLERDLRTTIEATYLDVPLLLTLAVPTGSAVRPRLYAGPTAGMERSCEAAATILGDPVYSGECAAADLPLDLDTPAVDWGLLLGGGLDIGAGPGALTLSARYRIGLSPVARTGADGESEITSRGLGIVAGYLFSLP